MTLIFKQTIKLCKDAQSDVKPEGGGGGGGQTLYMCVFLVCMCTRMCVYACMCSYAKKITKCMFTCSIGMLNIGSVMQL